MCPRKAGGFFMWGLKKAVRLKQCPLYGFHFRNLRRGSIYKTDGIKLICPSQQGLYFSALPIYAGFHTGSWLLANTYPDYQLSGLNTCQFISLFQWFKQIFGLIQQKKIKSLGNNDDNADQKAGRNDDNMLGIPAAHLELKHMLILCS